MDNFCKSKPHSSLWSLSFAWLFLDGKKGNHKNPSFHSWLTLSLNLLFFMGVKVHESKCEAYLNSGGHNFTSESLRSVSFCFDTASSVFELVSVISNIRRHVHHSPCKGFFKPCPSAGPEVNVSKTCAAEHGRAGRQPFLCVCCFLNAILDKVFLKITLHSFRFIVKTPPSNCFYQQTKRSH